MDLTQREAFPSLWLPALSHIPPYGHQVAAYPLDRKLPLPGQGQDDFLGNT